MSFRGRIKRYRRFLAYRKNGLNGPRAVARRARQIARGQLTASNGLAA